MGIMNLLFTFMLWFTLTVARELPLLNVDGFTWAENLCFDGNGNLFVSDAVRGELVRIYLCPNATTYCTSMHLNDGLKDIGGIQISSSGMIFAGATLQNGSQAIIATSVHTTNGSFEVVGITKNKANGFACDFSTNTCFCTDEGTGSEEGGTVTAFDLSSGTETVVKDFVEGADGAWLDTSSGLLYVGELLSLRINVFNISVSPYQYIGNFDGMSSLPSIMHMLDDITLDKYGSNPDTVLLGADWTGRSIQKFRLDGNMVPQTIPPPEGIVLFEPTSVRWGRGRGFDEESLYVTEGGGVLPSQTNRRVLQIKITR